MPGALLMLGAGLLIVGGIVGLAVWDARRRNSPAVVVDVAGAVARVWVAFTGVLLVATTWRWLSGGDTWIPDIPVVADLLRDQTCGDVTESVPATSMTLVCGYVQSADVTVAGLDAGIRVLLATADVLALFAAAAPGVVLAIACSRSLKGAPFARVVSRWMLIGAAVVLVAGLGAEILGSMGRSILANELFPPNSGDVSSTGVYRVSVSFWPIAAALALGALGAIFRHGERLQHDTEALV
ncbi:hypothetical protein OB08_13810 [Microbacterium sp. HJ5]